MFGRIGMRMIGFRAAAILASVLFLAVFAATPGHAYQELQQFGQAEARGTDGAITVEASIIHVVACNGAGENGGQFYIYQYTNRPGFRAILPPNWANALGGRDFATYDEAAVVACTYGLAQPPTTAVTYLGCFQDPNNPFDLDGYLERSAANTPKRCIEICRSRGFAYAGVQYGESCLCGNRYGQFGASSACTMPCTGDPSVACGGPYANSVYSTGAGGGPVAAAGITVLSGTYGANCGQPQGNVTAHLRSACEGKASCHYVIDYNVIGDPAFGCQKDYVATWSCGSGAAQSVQAPPEAGFGSPIDLRC